MSYIDLKRLLALIISVAIYLSISLYIYFRVVHSLSASSLLEYSVAVIIALLESATILIGCVAVIIAVAYLSAGMHKLITSTIRWLKGGTFFDPDYDDGWHIP